MAQDGVLPEVVEGEGPGLVMYVGGSDGVFPAVEGAGLGAEAFITRRSDHLGLPLVWRIATLEWLLPQGMTFWLGFFTDMPDRRGIGGVQLALDRMTVDRFTTSTIGARARRVMADSVVWPSPGLTEAATIKGWGLWDAATDGDLRAFDFLRTSAGKPRSFTATVGKRLAVGAGELGLIL